MAHALSSWRLRMSAATDPTPLKQLVNNKTGVEVFGPHDAMTLTGPEVSLAPTSRLLSFEHLLDSAVSIPRK